MKRLVAAKNPKLAGTVRHWHDHHLEFGLDRVAARPKCSPAGARIAGEHMDDALDFGDAVDVDAGATQSLDQGGEGSGPVLPEPNGKVSTHCDCIVGSAVLDRANVIGCLYCFSLVQSVILHCI